MSGSICQMHWGAHIWRRLNQVPAAQQTKDCSAISVGTQVDMVVTTLADLPHSLRCSAHTTTTCCADHRHGACARNQRQRSGTGTISLPRHEAAACKASTRLQCSIQLLLAATQPHHVQYRQLGCLGLGLKTYRLVAAGQRTCSAYDSGRLSS
jgi:hypothetical protein